MSKRKYMSSTSRMHKMSTFISKVTRPTLIVPRLDLLKCLCKFYLDCQTPTYVEMLEVSTLGTLTLIYTKKIRSEYE